MSSVRTARHHESVRMARLFNEGPGMNSGSVTCASVLPAHTVALLQLDRPLLPPGALPSGTHSSRTRREVRGFLRSTGGWDRSEPPISWKSGSRPSPAWRGAGEHRPPDRDPGPRPTTSWSKSAGPSDLDHGASRPRCVRPDPRGIRPDHRGLSSDRGASVQTSGAYRHTHPAAPLPGSAPSP